LRPAVHAHAVHPVQSPVVRPHPAIAGYGAVQGAWGLRRPEHRWDEEIRSHGVRPPDPRWVVRDGSVGELRTFDAASLPDGRAHVGKRDRRGSLATHVLTTPSSRPIKGGGSFPMATLGPWLRPRGAAPPPGPHRGCRTRGPRPRS